MNGIITLIICSFICVLFYILWFCFLKKQNKSFFLNLSNIIFFFFTNLFCFFGVLYFSNYVKNVVVLFIPVMGILISLVCLLHIYENHMFKKWHTYVYLIIVVLHTCASVYFLILLPWALSQIGPLYH